MSGPVNCPGCGAFLDPVRTEPCWLCGLPRDAEVVPPPAPLPLADGGFDDRATAAALVVGLVSVSAGWLVISLGAGLAATLVIILPVAWLVGDRMLSGPAAEPQAAAAPGPLRLVRRPKEPETPLEKVLKVIGTFIFICIVGGAAITVAAFAVCLYAMGHG